MISPPSRGIARLYVAGLWANSYREHGAEAASLSIRSGSSFSLESHLGFRLTHEWELNENFKLTPELSARWLH
ncbi:MAG: autotransporter outer membrane beta-barrel domain-containing protein [Lentisphaeria bacterium]|nr:MAG: autotransporter outer membrane beta-barrel domain-containing protein [Lentisphaeria bacterium]